jgi:hypothetical protein
MSSGAIPGCDTASAPQREMSTCGPVVGVWPNLVLRLGSQAESFTSRSIHVPLFSIFLLFNSNIPLRNATESRHQQSWMGAERVPHPLRDMCALALPTEARFLTQNFPKALGTTHSSGWCAHYPHHTTYH